MRIETRNNMSAAVFEKNTASIRNVQDALDLMADAQYNGCIGLIVDKDILDEKFFDLKTRFAGEILQKFSNYNMKIAIIGDFRENKSKSLADFIYECNKGNRVFFKDNIDDGINSILNISI